MTKEKTITIKKAAEITAECILTPLYSDSPYKTAVLSGLDKLGARNIIIHSTKTGAAFNVRAALDKFVDTTEHFENGHDFAEAIKKSLIPFLEEEIEKALEYDDSKAALDENPLE